MITEEDVSLSLDDLEKILDEEVARSEKTRFMSKVLDFIPNMARTAKKFVESPYGLPSFMPDYARPSYALKMLQQTKHAANTDSKSPKRYSGYLNHIMDANPIWMQLQKNLKK